MSLLAGFHDAGRCRERRTGSESRHRDSFSSGIGGVVGAVHVVTHQVRSDTSPHRRRGVQPQRLTDRRTAIHAPRFTSGRVVTHRRPTIKSEIGDHPVTCEGVPAATLPVHDVRHRHRLEDFRSSKQVARPATCDLRERPFQTRKSGTRSVELSHHRGITRQSRVPRLVVVRIRVTKCRLTRKHLPR